MVGNPECNGVRLLFSHWVSVAKAAADPSAPLRCAQDDKVPGRAGVVYQQIPGYAKDDRKKSKSSHSRRIATPGKQDNAEAGPSLRSG
jgi:hypothetical protein